jgi:ribokinase
MTPDVVVVGASNLDLCFRAAQLPGRGETVAGAEFTENLGGKAANQAVAAARIGAEVAFVSSLGRDEAGAELEQLLRSERIDMGGCQFVPGQRTGRACIWLDGDGENRILVAPCANAYLDEKAVREGLGTLSGAATVLCQLETPVEGVAAALAWARRAGARSIVNAAPAIPFEGLRVMPDVLVANEQEARLLLDSPDREIGGIAARLAERTGVALIVVTLGAAGALLWEGGEERRIATPAVRVRDTTGAGDAFCGALAARLAAGDEPVRAAELGCAAGALAIQRLGAMSSLPSLAEVEVLLADHGSI